MIGMSTCRPFCLHTDLVCRRQQSLLHLKLCFVGRLILIYNYVPLQVIFLMFMAAYRSRSCVHHNYNTKIFHRKPVLPIEVELGHATEEPANDTWDAEIIVHHADKMSKVKEAIHGKALANIGEAQKKDKFYYDKKHADNRVSDLHAYT